MFGGEIIRISRTQEDTMSPKIRTSKLFNDALRETLKEYGKASAEIDTKYEGVIERLVESAEIALQEENTPPVAVGTRVWVSGLNRMGTVTKTKLNVFVQNDDYYAPRDGPGRYNRPDSDYNDDKWGNYPGIGWSYTIQPDPSPKLRRVSPPMIQWSVQLEKGGPSVGGRYDDDEDLV